MHSPSLELDNKEAIELFFLNFMDIAIEVTHGSVYRSFDRVESLNLFELGYIGFLELDASSFTFWNLNLLFELGVLLSLYIRGCVLV